ncbi:MAG TPA: M23 family metallopeptidase [bacterium]|nr:M23 family metallopeptidase [bacterium]
MKNFLLELTKNIAGYLGIMVLGILLVVISFSSAVGFQDTITALFKGVNNFEEVNVFKRPEKSEQILGSAILGANDESYEGLDLTIEQIKPVELTVEENPTLFIPTVGFAGPQDFLYDPFNHPGVDIWSSLDGTGLNGTSRGYPVFSACSGKVHRVFAPNQEIEVICDTLDEAYLSRVPTVEIKVLYSHLGNGITSEAYHNLRRGDRVEKSELIGYQGNISSFAPRNKVVHLHFGVYDLSTLEPLDPAPYLGLKSIVPGQVF